MCVLWSSFVPLLDPAVILFFFFIKHRAKAMATRAASVSLYTFSRPDQEQNIANIE
jgi:hypothetical protein